MISFSSSACFKCFELNILSALPPSTLFHSLALLSRTESCRTALWCPMMLELLLAFTKKKERKKIDYSTTIIAPVSGCLSLGLFSNIFSILFIFPSTARAPLRFCLENDGHLLARWKRDKIISRLLRIHHDDDNGPRMDEKASWIEYIFFSTSLSSLRSALVAAVWHNRENEKSHRRRLLSRCCSDFESIKKLTS